MRKFSMREVAEVTGGRIHSGAEDGQVMHVSKDSRAVGSDTLFFALVGQNHDAHTFLPQVLANGCNNWVISKEEFVQFEGAEKANIICVDSTEDALVSLAVFALDEMKAIKIGVTGSVGKTSTKDMVYAVCSQKYITGKTQANLNTNIGISMCVLDFDQETKVAVLEMGADHTGEIDQVVQAFRPHIGLITNIGQSHLENFGTRDGIYRAKMEITNYFEEDDLLIIQQGDDYLRKEQMTYPFRIQSVGVGAENDFTVSDVGLTDGNYTEFDLKYQGETIHFKLPVLGAHHAINAAQASAVGIEIGIPLTQAAKGLAALSITAGRLDMKQEKGFRQSIIIDDSYNASPDSMRAGIRTLMSLKGPRKVAILGDMYELGVDTLNFHREIGEFAANEGLNLLLTVGDLAKGIAEAAGPIAHHFPSKQDLMAALPGLIQENDTILIKASRGMALDEVVEYLLDAEETQ